MVPLVFATQRYAYLARAVCQLTPFETGELEVATFPDGERYQRLVTEVEGRDVVLLGGTISDEDTLELYDLACGIATYGARHLTMVIPYFGHATMERAVRPREVVTAKTRARLFSSIPLPSDGAEVVMMDLHSEGIPHYFEGNLRRVHLYAKPVVLQAIREVGGASFVLGSTDAGRAKWVESLANELGVPAGFILKRRIDAKKTEVVALSADVKGAHVVLYDDMIRTGGSLLKAAEAYISVGAARVSVVATHGLFPGASAARLAASGVVQTVVVTDTHPAAKEHEGDFVKVVSVAPLLADYLTAPSLARG